MQIKIADLADRLKLSFVGDGELVVTHACGLDGADPGGIAYVEHARFAKRALQSTIEAFVCSKDLRLPGKTCILADDADLAIVAVTHLLHPARRPPRRIHPTLIRGQDCALGGELTIGANVTLGDRVRIGPRTTIMAGAVIGDDCSLGEDCLVHPNVSIRDSTQIGDRVIVNAGSVIGSDGYGFITHKGKHHKIPQVGRVIIEDDVEIGACNTIDRGRFGLTRIGKGSKLDNLVHVGHNVEIGHDALIVALVGFAGSTKAGHHLTMGGQSAITGHLRIGNHVTVSAKSLLTKSVGDGGRYAGIPARLHKEWLRATTLMYRLNEIFDFLKRAKKSPD